MSLEQPSQSLSPQEISKRAKSAFLWLSTTTLVWQLVAWAMTLLVARLLMPRDYGIVALAQSITPYLAMAATLNLPTWMAQTPEFSKDGHQRSLFTFTLLLGFLMSLIAFFSAPLVAAFYRSPDVVLPIQVVSGIFFLRGLYALPDSLLRRELHFKTIALMNLSVSLSRGVLQLLLAYWGFGYMSLIIGILYHEVFCAIWLVVVRGLPKGFAWDREILVTALKFGLPATGAHIFWIVFTSADRIIGGRLFPPDLLGIYAMAFLLTDMPMGKINTIFRPILIPYLSRLNSHEGELVPAFLRLVRAISAITFPVLIGISVVAVEAVPLILGNQWRELVFPLQIMCFVGFVRAFTDNISPLLFAVGRPGDVFRFNVIASIVMPPALYVLGKQFGLWGFYFSWLTVFSLLSLLMIRYLHRAIGVGFFQYIGNLAPVVLGVAFMGIATYFFRLQLLQYMDSSLFILLAEVLFGGFVYIGILALFFKNDVQRVLNLAKEADTTETAIISSS